MRSLRKAQLRDSDGWMDGEAKKVRKSRIGDLTNVI
jgi:hypothetical protein